MDGILTISKLNKLTWAKVSSTSSKGRSKREDRKRAFQEGCRDVKEEGLRKATLSKIGKEQRFVGRRSELFLSHEIL